VAGAARRARLRAACVGRVGSVDDFQKQAAPGARGAGPQGRAVVRPIDGGRGASGRLVDSLRRQLAPGNAPSSLRKGLSRGAAASGGAANRERLSAEQPWLRRKAFSTKQAYYRALAAPSAAALFTAARFRVAHRSRRIRDRLGVAPAGRANPRRPARSSPRRAAQAIRYLLGKAEAGRRCRPVWRSASRACLSTRRSPEAGRALSQAARARWRARPALARVSDCAVAKHRRWRFRLVAISGAASRAGRPYADLVGRAVVDLHRGDRAAQAAVAAAGDASHSAPLDDADCRSTPSSPRSVARSGWSQACARSRRLD